MRFTLHYEGLLPAKAKSNGPAKQAVRAALEPQLRELWDCSPLVESRLRDPEPGNLSAVFTKHGHTFVAVVSEMVGLRAELDILILRPTPGGMVVRGDIDNQLKVLFDALSAPAQKTQLAGIRPTSAEDPMYVLLEDDRLISRVNVESDRLLGTDDPESVRVIIRVETRIVKAMMGNISL